MKKLPAILMMILMVVSFWACESSSEAEKVIFRKPTAEELAADLRKADTTKIPDITKAAGPPEEIKIITPKQLKNHPLVALDKPEDENIIRYLRIDNMDWTCAEGEKRYRQDCEDYIKEAIKKCAAAGIKTTEKDFRNRAFIERQMQVLEKQKRIERTMHGTKAFRYMSHCAERLKSFKKGELIQ
jgi:hypothetical protein